MPQEVERVSNPQNAGSVAPAQALNLSSGNLIDLTGLTDEQVNELKRQHASGMIELKRKAEDLKIDVGALSMSLGTFNDEAAKATQANISMTLTHTQTSSIGRTEVVIGNTERAAAGKVSASAAGLADRTPWIIAVVAVCAVLVALIAFRH